MLKIEKDKETRNICGLGTNVFKIIDSKTTETIAYVGTKDEKKFIHMLQPCDIKLLESIVDFVKIN